MDFASPAELFGMDGIIVVMVVALVLFGSTQIPKLARSLGSAKREFAAGTHGATTTEPGSVVPRATHVSVVVPQADAHGPSVKPTSDVHI